MLRIMANDKTGALLCIAGKGTVRARDLDAARIPRAYLRKHRGGIDALVAAARADRVYAVMRPYLDALA